MVEIKAFIFCELCDTFVNFVVKNTFDTASNFPINLGINPSAIQRHIQKLKAGGIKRIGGDKGGHWEIINK